MLTCPTILMIPNKNTRLGRFLRALVNNRKQRASLVNAYIQSRRLLNRSYALPSFMIVGTHKGGTSDFYHNLVKHPQILPAIKKEIHYFSHYVSSVKSSDYPLSWYRACFPTEARLQQHAAITGEATPRYMFDPRAIDMIHQTLPDVKLILLLRNPIKRAYSHYMMEHRRDNVFKSFEDSIREELDYWAQTEITRETFEQAAEGLIPLRFTFVLIGVYVLQIQPILQRYPKEQVHIIQSEAYFQAVEAQLQQTFEFLGLPSVPIEHQLFEKKANKKPIEPTLYAELAAFYAPYNQALYDLLGRDFGW